ncbi:MAG: stage II sporulation protein D [Clostridia bacterium]|nr:stage II sporulation protein D [Clostridia bacterium]
MRTKYIYRKARFQKRKRFFYVLPLLPLLFIPLCFINKKTVPAISAEFPAAGYSISAKVPGRDAVYVNVYDSVSDTLTKMELEEYVYHVLASEMPASYPIEALKAQAVAARTYTLESMRALGGDGCSAHSGADICRQSAHCQSFSSDSSLKELWGDDYSLYRTKLKSAVSETSGQVMLYNGKPILALFHSSSASRTENVEDVYAMTLPYLRSVSTFDSPDDVPPVSLTYSLSDVCDRINSVYSGAEVSPSDLPSSLLILSRSEGGRVKQVKAGGVTLTGAQFRKLFSLNSSNFTFSFSKTTVTITTYGFGHGVGMSQHGAKQMALTGSSYDEILSHYYRGALLGYAD